MAFTEDDVTVIRDTIRRIRTVRLERRHDFRDFPGYVKGDEAAPFYSETFLYHFLGKGDARAVLYPVEHLLDDATRALVALEEARGLLRTIRKKALGATPHNAQLDLYLWLKSIGQAADEHLQAAEGDQDD